MCQIQDYDDLDLLPQYRKFLADELPLWHDYYLPIKERHLDLGAGCGETVRFALLHGAKVVYAFEEDEEARSCLTKNFGSDPRVQIFPGIDSLKCDIEGAEEGFTFETHYNLKPVKRNSVPWTYLTEKWETAIWKIEPR
jgi:hypothetical protein